jgi:hypothetical protein
MAAARMCSKCLAVIWRPVKMPAICWLSPGRPSGLFLVGMVKAGRQLSYAVLDGFPVLPGLDQIALSYSPLPSIGSLAKGTSEGSP